MLRIVPAVLPLLVMSLAGAADAAETPAPAAAATMATLPERVRVLLAQRYGEIADAGAPISEWCVVKPGTVRARLVTIEMEPDQIRVRYQHGGIAGLQEQLVEYRQRDGHWTELGVPAQWNNRVRRFTSALESSLPGAHAP